jgi:hypothetical protein
MRIPIPLVVLCALVASSGLVRANGNVHVTRFWHNHQPIYWPEWMGSGGEPDRGQLAWDSIQKKPTQNYGGLSPNLHPQNDLNSIFGTDDRRGAYQDRPKKSLERFSGGGFALSYSGSLMDNVRQLGSGGHLGYSGNWNSHNITAKSWGRLDLVGFTYHHSLAPLLPKEVFRKELQTFKQNWYKSWAGAADLSDHSKGFFPTEMAYTRDMIDVLVDEGYEWLIVASHHISRTSPTYNEKANPEGNFAIHSSPPNKADQVGPVATNGWWFGAGQVEAIKAWNLAPYAYQLHKVKYVNPETGAEKLMVAVPSDDIHSYGYGYGDVGIGMIQTNIAPFATDPQRPVVVMPSTDGDNAWGGGYDSWEVATPNFFNSAAGAGFVKNTPGAFVNAFKAHAPVSHIEDGAWIFPESCYGSPNFLKWIEPPLVNPGLGATNRYPGTAADMETPGFALKFFSYAPLMAGANWVITAEQILKDQGGQVRPWVIQAPYGVGGGEFPDRNDVELAWHIYLKGLDSGFNYYGGLGNDDEAKPGLATKRAVDRLRTFMSTRMNEDRTGPTVLKPQRFPYNPGWYTFGWFNRIPGDLRSLKRMPSYFYIWTHAYDLSGVTSVNLKIRRDKDGTRSLANNHNVTYAGGSDVEDWITIPMTKRELPETRAALNAAANNSEIDYFVFDPAMQPATGVELADYYFVRLDDASLPGFRDNLFDYYIESTDARGNISKSEIQHVWVEDDGETPSAPGQVTGVGASGLSLTSIRVSWTAVGGATGYSILRGGTQIGTTSATSFDDTGLSEDTEYSYTVVASNAAGDGPASAPATGRTLAFIDSNPAALIVTAPAGPTGVASNVTTFTFTGQAGAWLTNGINWTNLLTGQAGSFARLRDWSLNVPLGAGTNNLVFSAAYAISGEQTNASDSPVNASYAGGWTNGSTGGTGFGPWTLSSTGSGGHFLADNPTNLSTGLSKGFGLWANSGGLSTARRDLGTNLPVGGRFRLRFDNNWIDTGGAVGFALADAGGTNRFAFFFTGGQANYRVSDAQTNRDTGIAYSSTGLDIAFELTASNAYSLTVGTNSLTGTLAPGGSLARLLVTNNSAGPNTERNLYLGAMSLTTLVSSNGTVTTNAPAVARASGGMTDGLPDDWWSGYFPDPSDWVAAADADGDGHSNADEHALGTNPADPTSRFAVHQASNSGGSITVSWTSVPGKTYRLQARPSLTEGSWQDVGGEITASSESSSTTHDATGQQFYRVRLVP